MPAVIYNDYLIIAVAKQEPFAGRWSVCVDLSTRDAGRPISSFETHHEFENQRQAEDCGLTLARAWIDQRVKRFRNVERQPDLALLSDSTEAHLPEHPAANATVSSTAVELRSEVREFAQRIEETLRRNEKKRSQSWMNSNLEALVHEVLDSTSALLMTNYKDDSERTLLQDTCVDLATVALVIRRKSMRLSNAQPELRLPEHNKHGRNIHDPVSATENRKRPTAVIRKLKPRGTSLL